MKQFNLTVPKPCHEKWDQMTPEDKGRFCGSCQKVVVDFTGMSDRELAAFFKKPVGSVCGRFHQDQLNRTLVVPKKRIPWIKYFFTITWPAFVWMLKSCGLKDNVLGIAIPPTEQVDKTNSVGSYEVPTMGVALTPDAIPEDSIAEMQSIQGEVAAVDIIAEPGEIMGDVAYMPADTTEKAPVYNLSPEEDSANQYVTMDTVTVIAPSTISCGRITMGAVAYGVTIQEDQLQKALKEPLPHIAKESGLLFHPNPIQAGGTLHVRFTDTHETAASIQVLTSSGQRILFQPLSSSLLETDIQINLPAGLSAGIYFIQVLYKNGEVRKSSILVSR